MLDPVARRSTPKSSIAAPRSLARNRSFRIADARVAFVAMRSPAAAAHTDADRDMTQDIVQTRTRLHALPILEFRVLGTGALLSRRTRGSGVLLSLRTSGLWRCRRLYIAVAPSCTCVGVGERDRLIKVLDGYGSAWAWKPRRIPSAYVSFTIRKRRRKLVRWFRYSGAARAVWLATNVIGGPDRESCNVDDVKRGSTLII
jgi:hypothetical protein